MSDDLLERATRALREEGLASREELAETRARVLMSIHGARAQRMRAVRWVLPLAAAFAAGTAFAHYTGKLERAVEAVHDWIAPKSATERAPAKKRAHPRIAVPTPQAAPIEPPPAPVPAERAEPVPASGPETRGSTIPKRIHGPSPRAQEGTEPPPSASDGPPNLASDSSEEPANPATPRAPNPDLALYKEAHRLHFSEKDYGRAVSVWERYLQDFPHGIFALEARYNHALCLVRLGRTAEAIRELMPFADGEVARGYRREDAQALLKALQHGP